MKHIIRQNQTQLVMLASFLQLMDSQTYQKKRSFMLESSVGMHVRHILEFYDCLLENELPPSSINYNQRQRDLNLESNPDIAILKIDCLIKLLDLLPDEPHSILVITEGEDYDITSHESSIERELLYLNEHTTHHMAIIRMAACHFLPAYSFPESFGIAPSTLHYRHHKRHSK